MTWAEFKKKWQRYAGKESSAYQEHFNDLCQLLGQKTPAEADPTGSEVFCFQKRVVKDAELLMVKEDSVDYGKTGDRGFADVWKKDCFAWEYKGKKKNLDEAYRQLLRYRESLLNPPLLVVCDFDRYIVRTNFNDVVQETHEFRNADIDAPHNLRILKALFADPEALRPLKTTREVTEALAAQIAAIARSLQDRESVELSNARTRKEVQVGQKKNLRIARFLNRIIFCLFAEDVGLLPKDIFRDLAKQNVDDPRFFAERLEDLFRKMAKGGSFGPHKIRYFNGHLFEEATVFELTEEEIRALAEAAEPEWEFVQPSIMGTLFERALDGEGKLRAQLGAHYTSEEDIKTLVEPVLMQPLRREWVEIKRDLIRSYAKGKGTATDRVRLTKFLKKLSTVTVLDPACGSGNFLYVSLQLLLSLEKEVIAFATQLDFKFTPQVGVQQLKAIEINPYAFELAQVSVQIGYLQWLRDNGFPLDRTPVLQVLDGFQNEDALLVPHFHNKAKSLKQARAKEHEEENALKFYTERVWPESDVVVSNPPFLGNKRLRTELGDEYTKAIFDTFGDRLPATSDFCCYWFEKARELIATGKCQRAGLLATTGSKQVSSRRAFERIKETGKIFFAISDRDWWDEGTAIRICMVGFGGARTADKPVFDGKAAIEINADLSSGLDTTGKRQLFANKGMCFMGSTKVGDFDIPDEQALTMLLDVNPHGKPNSDVICPFRNGSDLVRACSSRWIIDYGVSMPKQDASRFESPFKHLEKYVKPFREHNNRAHYRDIWWIHAEARPGFRKAVSGQHRYIGTARVAKHRVFVWLDPVILPDSKVIAIAFADDFHLGVLQSQIHEVWTLATCGWHGKGNDATYNPTECFETFPFPKPTKEQEAAIAAAAKELDELRERWLNPPEWTVEKVLEFPGSVDGPWARYVVPESVVGGVSNPDRSRLQTAPTRARIGLVRYPRLEPKDADCAKKLKDRTLTKLYNERPTWLDLAHKKLDAAVAAAYGWPADLTDEQILERLLKLNLERAEEEVKTGQIKKPKTSRAKQADELI